MSHTQWICHPHFQNFWFVLHIDDVWNMTSKGETVNLWCYRVGKRDELSGNKSEQEDERRPK